MRLKPQFDATPAVTLLRRWIVAFGLPAMVESLPQKDLIVFRVTVTNYDAYRQMIRPVAAGWMFNETLLGAFWTLFNAIGRKHGASIHVVVQL